MRPARVVERLSHFKPRFCPRRDCPEHQRRSAGYRCTPCGFYQRQCDGRIVPRFLCGTCGRTFSQQTFAFSYYLKRPKLTIPIAKGLVAGSAHRQIARSVGCHHSTVTARSRRLGRHGMLFHTLALRRLRLDEPVVVDDFDSFAGSQFFPCTLPTATGWESWFVYGFAFSRERRRGHLSPWQKTERERLEGLFGRPRRGAVRDAFAGLIEALPPTSGALDLISDADRAIRSAVRVARRRIRHRAYANPRRGPKGSPRSPEAVTRDIAMFPNDQLHRFLRHTLAAHRRETIAFGRSYCGLAERMAAFVVWRNFVQARSERRPRDGTTAMHLGLTRRPWRWLEVLAKRLFPDRVRPDGSTTLFYRRQIDTPHLKSHRRHDLRLAF